MKEQQSENTSRFTSNRPCPWIIARKLRNASRKPSFRSPFSFPAHPTRRLLYGWKENAVRKFCAPISKRTRSPRTTSGFSGRALKRGASGKLDSTRQSRAILILEIESVARWKSSTDVTISRRRLEESERGTRVTDARVQREFIPRRVPNCDPSTPRDARGSPYFNFSTDSNPKNTEGFRKFGLKKQNLSRFKRQLKKQLELKKQNL